MRCILLVLLCASSVRADLPTPRLDRVLPCGGAAGSTVDVEIGGPDLDEPKQLLFDHPGIKSEFVKDKTFRITIAADVPGGTYDVRCIGKYGLSNPRLFAVSRGLTERRESAMNDSADKAMVVSMNVVVNGSTDGNREDFYRFPAKKGQRIVIDCQAALLESPLDGNLALFDRTGKQLASSGDYNGRDPFIDFLAPADDDYIVSVYDLSYRGGNYYRLIISDRPSVETIFPRAFTHGQAADVQLIGRNLGAEAKTSRFMLNGLPMQERTIRITPPADVLPLRQFTFREHPTDYSVLPTAATSRLCGFQVALVEGETTSRAHAAVIVDGPVTLDQEPNDTVEKAQSITLPAVVSGRFDASRDADWYQFECPADGTYQMQVYSEQIGARADPYIVVFDEQGQRIVEHDDYGARVNAFDSHLRDPWGTINLTAKKKYRLLVQDRYRRGGARFQYVMVFRKQVPDFHVSAIHSANPGPLPTNIWKGGAAWLDLVFHLEGYNGPITITANGLPAGVHAAPTIIHNNGRGAFVLWADENAADFAGSIELMATATIDGKEVRRIVKPFTRVLSEQSSRPTREQAIGVNGSAPFALTFTPDTITIEQGKKATVKVNVQRRWPDFKAKLNLQSLMLPNNLKMDNAEIGEGKNDVMLTLEANNNMVVGTHTFSITGQAQVPYQRDPKMAKANQLVTLPSQPLRIEVVAAKKDGK